MRGLLAAALLTVFLGCTEDDRLPAKFDPGQSLYDRVHAEADLPTGGKCVDHPKKPGVRYYFTNRLAMWGDKSNTGRHSGLYMSEDGGATWKLRCYIFEFQKLFIHPETGTLYAIIYYEWLKDDEDGFLHQHCANKAVMSDDGRHWKDITGGYGYIADITGIIADPDHPRRVCLEACVGRGYVLQASDDSYSRWTWYREREWPERKRKK